MRLDAYLARSGHGSRKEVKQLIRKGLVTVDGEPCRDQARAVSESAEIRCGGERVELPPRDLHVIMNKPASYACSRDPREAPLVNELLPERWQTVLEPAGRLDRGTTGLLVFSSEGPFIHSLIHPRRKVSKRYRIRYRGQLPRDAVKRCAEGLMLGQDRKRTRPALLHVEECDAEGGVATLILHEGRFHQVRRMFQALRCQVIQLHRDRIGALDLPADLEPGQSRELTLDERERLFAAAEHTEGTEEE